MDYISHNKYKNAEPFPHFVVKDFFNTRDLKDCALVIENNLNNLKWKEQSRVTDHQVNKRWIENAADMPREVQKILWQLHSAEFLNFLKDLTGIKGIIDDPSNIGGGIHCTSRGGKLNVHQDFDYNPETSLCRQINVLVFLNENWMSDWKGDLELWDKDLKRKQVSIKPDFNTMVIFNTANNALHGCPEPLECPPERNRISLATYYYTHNETSNFKNLSPYAKFYET
jgi:Rps23 Pro-64 3,4-dihydroxylase Tpa1-like proline 4-hydroxylase